MKSIIVLLICVGFPAVNILYCQSEVADLQQRIRGLNSPYTVMEQVDALYAGRDIIPDGPKFKHWVRWAHWWSTRTNADGTFADVVEKNRAALEQWPELRNSGNLWTSIGPFASTYASNGVHCRGNGYGRLDRIAFHPSDPNVIYVGGPYGGLWRTSDGGSNWAFLTDHLPGIGVGGIAVDHSNPNTIYLLSGSGDDGLSGFVADFGYFNPSDGIFKSVDNGANWSRIYDFPITGTRARRLKQHPSDPDVLFALTDTIIYRTQNAGITWDSVFAGEYVDIEFHPTDHDTTYITGFADFRFSYDQGTSWSTSAGLAFCGMRAEIAVSPGAPNNVWLLAGNGFIHNNNGTGPNTYCGLYRSSDSGQTFSLINSAPDILSITSGDQSNYDLVIAVDPLDTNNILAGAITLWRNPNAGVGAANWTNVAPYWETTGSQQFTAPTNYLHPDVHDLAFNPLDNKVYAASDGGIYVSSDNGITWTNITQGIIVSQIYNINGTPAHNGRLAIGLQDNGTKLRVSTTSQNFLHVQSGDCQEADIDPTNVNVIAASINRNCYRYNPYTTSNRDTIVLGGQWMSPLKYKPGTNDTLYFAGQDLRIYDVSSQSASIISLGNSASWTIETCADDPDRIYFAGGFVQFPGGFLNDPNGKFYLSLNGTSATDQSTSPGFPTQLQKITDIDTDPDNCANVVFSMGGYIADAKVYYSTSSGGSWQNISYNLPNVPVHAVTIDGNGNFYAGTEIGVFVKTASGTEWAPFYNGLPRVPVSGLFVQENTGKLIAATFGRGVWEAFLASGCPVNKLVSGNVKGQRYYGADLTLGSTAIVTGGAGTDVLFSAGNRITLETGFLITGGSRLIAALDGCIE